jgi:DNA (cytosine-5)-methyltransferase 1
LSGHSDESKPKRKETSADASRGIGADDRLGADQYNAVILGDTVSTLGVNCGMSHDRQCVLEPKEVVCFEPGIASREGGHVYEGVSGTLRAKAGDNQMATAYTLRERAGCAGGGKGALIQIDKSGTLSTSQDQTLFQPVYSVENHPNDSRVGINDDGIVQALTSRMGTGGGNVPMVMQCYSKQRRAQSKTDFETWKESEKANTLNAFDIGDVRTTEAVVYCVDQGGGKSGVDVKEDKAPTLTTTHDGAPVIAMNLCGEDKVGTLMARDFKGVGRVDTFDRVVCTAVDGRNGTENEVNGALQSNSAHSLNGNNVVRTRYIVRRLTPLECERLQGYPDGWTDIGEWTDTNGKKRQTSDAARYKALGNSIALPPWKWVLKRICACYERDATMASLFDGIGGFPYLWEQLNGKGTCLWASEIEEFPIAVTKVRIGE